MIKRVVLVIATVAVSACAANYTHLSKSELDFERDMYQCEREAAPVQDRARNRQMIDRCMRVLGWRQDGYKWVAVSLW
jgi:hypothetical protein